MFWLLLFLFGDIWFSKYWHCVTRFFLLFDKIFGSKCFGYNFISVGVCASLSRWGWIYKLDRYSQTVRFDVRRLWFYILSWLVIMEARHSTLLLMCSSVMGSLTLYFTCNYKIASVFVRFHWSLKICSIHGSIEILFWHIFIFLSASLNCENRFGGIFTCCLLCQVEYF